MNILLQVDFPLNSGQILTAKESDIKLKNTKWPDQSMKLRSRYEMNRCHRAYEQFMLLNGKVASYR